MSFKIDIKPQIKSAINYILFFLARVIQRIDRDNVPNPNAFDDLSPIDNVSNIKTYNEALEWALDNKRIKNIAVTGPYGSGKSSLLKTFEKNHSGIRFLNVSLASFEDEIEGADKDDLQRLIELSIIQQMFYRVKGKKIPDSRFNRIKNLTVWRITYMSFFTLCAILGMVLILFPYALKRISGWNTFNQQHAGWMLCIGIILTLPAFYNLQSYILRLINTSKFNKINLSKGEFEIDPKSETSILNKHLDEMLYFFEVTKYDVVIFEDLDRFNDPEIFTKLRELNILVNQSMQINKRIVFIYAIKDNMFKDKTRTKFFDFIIPVIPVINWSNSYEIMIDKFKNEKLGLTVTEKFISAVTLYIDDMRALKNIFNEFMLYKENLKGIALIQDKLLAIIIYKNMFPDDFAELHENKGMVFNAFAKKPELINSVIEVNQQLIKKNQAHIAQFQERLAHDVRELRAIYLQAFQKLSPNANALNKGGYIPFFEVQQNDAYFEWFRQQNNISAWQYTVHYGTYNRQQLNTNISFSAVEQEVSKELTYQDRLALIESRETSEVQTLNAEIQQAEQLISQFHSYSLKELLDQYPDYLSSFSEDFRNRKLLVYLVREGYIDENYPSLISYFYEGSLTYRDMAFILSIRNRENLEYDYALDTIPKILERLEPEDFDRRQILNIQLINFLLSSASLYKKQLTKILRRLSNQSEDSLKLIEDFITSGTERAQFFKLLFNQWPGMWDYIYDTPTFQTDQKNKYLKLVIAYADDSQLKKLNGNKNVEKYIKSLPDFLTWFKEPKEIQRVKELIKLFTIKFNKIDKPENSEELFEYILANRSYMLVEDMIRLIVFRKGADAAKHEKLINTANYSAIQLSAYQPLIQYVEDNLSDYVESIILLSQENTEDTEEDLIKLLNTDSLSDEIKVRLIAQEKAKFKAIQSLPQSLWVKLLEAGKLEVTWANVMRYFALSNTFDETLIKYLNRRDIYLELAKSRSDSDKSVDQTTLVAFGTGWLQQNSIDDEAYEALIKKASHYYPPGASIDQLSERKVKALVRSILRLTPETFNLVNSKFPLLTGLFIASQIEAYFKAQTNYPLAAADLTYLLGSPSVNANQKSLLIPLVTESMLDGNTALLNLYVPEILRQDSSYKLNSSQLIIVMGQSHAQMRKKLLLKYYDSFTNDQIIELLPGLGKNYDEILADGKTISMELTELDRSLAQKLKGSSIIADVQTKKKELLLVNFNPPPDQPTA